MPIPNYQLQECVLESGQNRIEQHVNPMKPPTAHIHPFSRAALAAVLQLTLVVCGQAATFTVTTTADSGPGSLRQAIDDANLAPGTDTIAFNIAGPGPHTIQPLTELPTITDPVAIDGYSQPGSSVNTLAQGDNAVLKIQLNGILAGPWDSGLHITAGNSTVRGLVINRFGWHGVLLTGPGGNVIAGNFLGTDVSGTAAAGNGWNVEGGGDGIFIGQWDAVLVGGNVVGGTTLAARNLISGNQQGIVLANSDANQLLGNFIGTDASGTAVIPNTQLGGIAIWGGTGNRIGAPGAGNLISGNIKTGAVGEWDGGFGIMTSWSDAVVIEGNLIGTDVTGTAPLGNQIGVSFSGNGATIGGTAPGARNLVSGNQFQGMALGGKCIVQGNRVGTDINGTTAIPNDYGIVVYAQDCLIGGTDPNARNLISGNANYGLQIHGAYTLVQGNFIGTDATGSGALPNFAGVIIFSGGNVVGGSMSGAGNLISGNGYGVDIRGSETKLQGNLIGTDLSGTQALPNTGIGVYLADVSPNNLIGGATTGAGNIISGNNLGIDLNGPGVTGTRVQGNLIGTDAGGAQPLGNATHGVLIENGASGNSIGGSGGREGNTIAHNGSLGVFVAPPWALGDPTSIGNSIRGNSVFGNTPMGIDLEGNGISVNDLLDADAGPNNLQNFPTITSAAASLGGIQIQGKLQSAPNTTFTLDFYANQAVNPSGYFEGETYLGAASATTDGDGNVSFNVTLPTTVNAGRIITATATDPDGNTSEFSQSATTEGPITQGPNGHYYQIVRTRFAADDFLTWDEAKVAAEQRTFGCLQGHLATITSRAEDEFVEALRLQFVAGAPEHVDPHLPDVQFWVGGYQDNDQATPGDGWHWINNEGPIPGDNNGSGYANWYSGEPNDSPIEDAEHNTENHLTVGRFGGLGWNDYDTPLTSVYGYIIEYDGAADITPPQIASLADITVSCSTELLVPVTFSVMATDNCDPAPVVTCSPASGSGFPVGTTTVSCTATDASGNSSTRSFTVTRAALGFAGFLPPIGGADATGGSFASPVRTFKHGSTIPVKFSASCEGAPVLTGIHRLQAVKYSDATTAAAPIDATPQDAATTGNQFRLADSQWHFNLDTKAAGMTTGIWQLVATLADGSHHRVWIQIK